LLGDHSRAAGERKDIFACLEEPGNVVRQRGQRRPKHPACGGDPSRQVRLDEQQNYQLARMTVTVQQMLDALARVAGEDKLQYIEQKKDEFLERIVTSWPSHFDTSKADQLGFSPDPGLESAIKAYIDSM
jgi:nucleoside-diphosphate-sugar epimerase